MTLLGYQFYDTKKQELYGKLRPEPYAVDGKPASPPKGSVEMAVIQEDQPAAGHQVVESEVVKDVDAKEYRHGWKLRDKTPEELAAEARKIWPSHQELYAELTPEEKRKAIKACRSNDDAAFWWNELVMWHAAIVADDPRVIAGLDIWVAAGVLTADRKKQLLTK